MAADPCCLTTRELKQWFAGGLTEEAKRSLQDHLASCAHCRAELEDQYSFEEIQKAFLAGPAARGQPTPPLPDWEIPEHTVQRYLGGGGFGDVWLAWHRGLNQYRAVKVLHPEHFNAEGRAALRNEARLMARLQPHRNRVQVFDFVEQADRAFLVMAYVEGGSLAVERLPLHWERAVRYMADAAEGLAEVHAAGILHRDLKPANLLWDPGRDTALVSDYGLAAHVDAQATVGWTLGYAAPEVLALEPATPTSDVFALAASLYHLALGRRPFEAPDRQTNLAQARAGLLETALLVPPALERVIRAGLEPDSAKRPDLAKFRAMLRGVHMGELAEELRRLACQSRCPTQVKVTLSAATESEKQFRPVLHCASPEARTAAQLRTGDLARIDVRCDTEGYLTILNFSSAGDLEVMLPNPLAADCAVRRTTGHRLTMKLTEPTGVDYTAVIWTRDPAALTPEQWRNRIAARAIADEADRAAFVDHETGELFADEWTAVVVTLLHPD